LLIPPPFSSFRAYRSSLPYQRLWGTDSTSIPTAAQAATLATEPPKEEQEKEYIKVQSLLDTEMKEIFVLNDIPVLIEIPNVVIGDAPEIGVERKPEPTRIIPIIRTPRREPVVEPEFSIYAVSPFRTNLHFSFLTLFLIKLGTAQHPSSPLLNKAMYITPVRQAFLASGDIDLTLLRAASERVSEILQENRRRVDAGEDPSTVRSMSSEFFSRISSQSVVCSTEEARRRRAQEISTARQNIAGLSVLEL
jgi:hypothetical protein